MNNLFVFGKAVSGDAFTDREEETKKLVSSFKGIRVVVCIDKFQQLGLYSDTALFHNIWQHRELTSCCLFGSKKHMMESLFDCTSKPFYKFQRHHVPTAHSY